MVNNDHVLISKISKLTLFLIIRFVSDYKVEKSFNENKII
jgi:hypothetical protein